MSDVDEMRQWVVAEAESWLGTPYVSNQMVKGKVGGGTDCAMLLIGVYGNLGLLPNYTDPRPYAPEWHVHQREEKYMEEVLRYAKEVEAPPARIPKPGDLVMFQIGRVFAHGAIVTLWPNVIHAIGNNAVMREDVSKSTLGKRALARMPQRFFSLWND